MDLHISRRRRYRSLDLLSRCCHNMAVEDEAWLEDQSPVWILRSHTVVSLAEQTIEFHAYEQI
jgi:hypothetical protein